MYLAVLACLMSPMAANADPMVAELSGLSGTDEFIDFGANLFPNLTPITNEFSGITIQHARYFTTGSVNNIVGGFITNDFSGSPNTLSIAFDQDIADLSFAYHQIGTSMDSVFRAMLDGIIVESFSNLSNQSQPNNYFGFTDIFFDELQIDFVGDFNVDSLAFNFVQSVPVTIDIKPGSDPNGVNPRSKGVIPVAVLGSVDFDATQVDFTTVAFGPSGAAPVHDGHVEDVNSDGFADMVFHFKIAETGIACGDADATLTGETSGGDPFEATDAVKTAGCK